MLERRGSFIKVDERSWMDVGTVRRVSTYKFSDTDYQVEIEADEREFEIKRGLSKEAAEALRDQIVEQMIKIKSEARYGL